MPIFLPRTRISAPSHTLLLQSFLHRKKQISFCRRPFAATCSHTPPDKQHLHVCAYRHVVGSRYAWPFTCAHLQKGYGTYKASRAHMYRYIHTPHKVPGAFTYAPVCRVPRLCPKSCIVYVCSDSPMQEQPQDTCMWVCLECPSTHVLLEIYHSSLQTFPDRQEHLQESREVLSTPKAKVSFQPRSLAVRDCGSPLAECKRDVSHAEVGLVCHGRPLLCVQSFPSQGSSFQGVCFLHLWGPVRDF